jgi:hypothetical protein
MNRGARMLIPRLTLFAKPERERSRRCGSRFVQLAADVLQRFFQHTIVKDRRFFG